MQTRCSGSEALCLIHQSSHHRRYSIEVFGSPVAWKWPMFLNESPRCHIVLRASPPGIIISPSCFQADTVAFVNEYLTSAGNLTRCMLCVAQSLEHAQSSQFSAVSSSQPGSCACSLIVLRGIVTTLLQENLLLSREAASFLCSSGSIQVQVELIGRISTSTRLQARAS